MGESTTWSYRRNWNLAVQTLRSFLSRSLSEKILLFLTCKLSAVSSMEKIIGYKHLQPILSVRSDSCQDQHLKSETMHKHNPVNLKVLWWLYTIATLSQNNVLVYVHTNKITTLAENINQQSNSKDQNIQFKMASFHAYTKIIHFSCLDMQLIPIAFFSFLLRSDGPFFYCAEDDFLKIMKNLILIKAKAHLLFTTWSSIIQCWESKQILRHSESP